MRISDWSSDVCSSDLVARCIVEVGTSSYYASIGATTEEPVLREICRHIAADELRHYKLFYTHLKRYLEREGIGRWKRLAVALGRIGESEDDELAYAFRSEEHTSELQSLMRISYAVFCLKKKIT